MTNERLVKEYANGDALYKRNNSFKYSYVAGEKCGYFYASSDKAAIEEFRHIRKGK